MYKVLCLDGGGLRGLYTLKILDKIEKDYSIKIHEYFDLIVGTSTGSIIATLLSLGYEINDIEKIYYDSYKNIFKTDFKNRGLLNPIYEIDNLKKEVNSIVNSYNYENLKTDLIIPSTNLSNSEINIVIGNIEKTKPLAKRFSLVDAIVSSCAAPGYFKPNLYNDKFFVDGSIYANNPSLIALSYAMKIKGDINQIKILSIGTGKNVYDYNYENFRFENILNQIDLNDFVKGMLSKFSYFKNSEFGLLSMGRPLLKTTLRTSTEIVGYVLENILPKNNYVRINDISEGLKVDCIPDDLINRIDELYTSNHKEKLSIFFKEKKIPFWKEIILDFLRKTISFLEGRGD